MSWMWLLLACPGPAPTLPMSPPPSANLPITPMAPSLPGDDPSATIAAQLAAELAASRRFAPPTSAPAAPRSPATPPGPGTGPRGSP